MSPILTKLKIWNPYGLGISNFEFHQNRRQKSFIGWLSTTKWARNEYRWFLTLFSPILGSFLHKIACFHARLLKKLCQGDNIKWPRGVLRTTKHFYGLKGDQKREPEWFIFGFEAILTPGVFGLQRPNSSYNRHSHRFFWTHMNLRHWYLL